MKTQLCQLYYYVPTSQLQITQNAIFSVGAGRIGHYSCCAWYIKGTGQFKPETKSQAYLGKIGKISKVVEYKVETVCASNKRKTVIKALKKAHPYECLVFGILKVGAKLDKGL